jgi:hypothetical protein
MAQRWWAMVLEGNWLSLRGFAVEEHSVVVPAEILG